MKSIIKGILVLSLIMGSVQANPRDTIMSYCGSFKVMGRSYGLCLLLILIKNYGEIKKHSEYDKTLKIMCVWDPVAKEKTNGIEWLSEPSEFEKQGLYLWMAAYSLLHQPITYILLMIHWLFYLEGKMYSFRNKGALEEKALFQEFIKHKTQFQEFMKNRKNI